MKPVFHPWHLALVALAAGHAFSTAVAQTTLPTAAVRNVTDTFFGTRIDDPYRHFENKDDPQVAQWMKAHSAHAQAELARIPGRSALLAQITAYDSAVADRVPLVLRRPGELYFSERRSATDNQYKLYMRRGLRGSDRLLVDPEVLAAKTGKPHAVNWFVPSPDGALLAFGLSSQGDEAAVMHVLDTRSGKPVGKPIDRADFGAVSWAPDGKSLVFSRLQELRKGAPATDKYQHSQTYLLRAGQPATTARVVFGTALKGLGLGAAELPSVSLSHDGRWAIGVVANGTQRELGVFVSAQEALLAGKPQWRRVIQAADAVTGVSYFNNTLYLVSHQGATRSQVLALPLKSPDMARAQTVMPASERVVVSVAAAADALYIEAREGNVKRLYKRAHSSDEPPVEVPLPLAGAFDLYTAESGESAAHPRLAGVTIGLQSWSRAQQIYQVAADGRVTNTGLQPAGPHDAPAGLVATEVQVKSHDGALVPLSIVHRADTPLDGRNPTLLYAYASYGMTEEPSFSAGRLAWLDAGGVFAVANPRGSGVYGEDWYRGGFQATKPNTWRDFIACAEYLVAQKYTQPARLGILGGSAGGIVVGRAMTERPDLFAAAVPAVGVLDTLRMEFSPNGVPNIPEFGSVKTEAGFKSLLAMSTYAHVKPGVAYPAVMLTHGVNDPRVEVWESTKTAARLLAASTSGRPVLLRLDYDAGHGIGNTKQQALQERADIYAFFLWQMGVPGYQPGGVTRSGGGAAAPERR